jgi:hypothetical protein
VGRGNEGRKNKRKCGGKRGFRVAQWELLRKGVEPVLDSLSLWRPRSSSYARSSERRERERGRKQDGIRCDSSKRFGSKGKEKEKEKEAL